MKWLIRFLGTQDKEQLDRTERIAKSVTKTKRKFSSQMNKLKAQARKVHMTTKKAHSESVRLVGIVDDITAKIAIATGNGDL